MIKDFRDHFINIDSTTYKATLEENEIYQLQNIFGGLKYSNKKSLSTRKFCESFITY